MWRTRGGSRSFCATIRASTGSTTPGFADNPYYALAQKYLGGRACSLLTFGVQGGFEAGKRFYDALKLIKRLVNHGRRQVAGLSPGLDHPPPDVAGRAAQGRRDARR